MNLTKIDYVNILNYYEINFNEKMPINLLRKMVEKIIAEKLCRCVKKVPNEGNPESRAIGICNYSVVKRKQLKINGFSCKKKRQLKQKKTSKKGDNHALTKTTKQMIVLRPKRQRKTRDKPVIK